MIYLLYDDDCGICTKFAKFISRMISIPHIPMHEESAMKRGISLLGDEKYWASFHIVEGDTWTTESGSISALSRLLPFGSLIYRVVDLKPVMYLLMRVLKHMQEKRNQTCTILV